MPQIYQTTLWRLELPDAWKWQGSGEHVMFFRPDGVGQLQVHSTDSVSGYDLMAYARDHSSPGTTFTNVSCGRLHGIAGVCLDRDTLWRTWWLLCRGHLVYAAYQCAAKNSQEESDEIDQIVQSLDESDAL